MLVCSNVTKKYGSAAAVDGVSITLEPGHIYALLGPNGSGKTTLMKMIAGLVKPTAGAITFESSPVGIESKKHIAYMPTESYFYQYMSCEDAGKYYQDFFDDFSMDYFHRLLQDMELDASQKISKMSSGMLAKLKIAITLARDSSLIMLDEPLNGIDIIAREKIISSIIACASGQRSIIISSHLVDELEPIIDYAVFIRNGIVAEQGEAELLRENSGKSIVDIYKEIYR